MLLQEYLRARAAAAGMTEVGVVTVWERPTRVIVDRGVPGQRRGPRRPVAGRSARGPGSALGVVGLVQLAVVVRRRLG